MTKTATTKHHCLRCGRTLTALDSIARGYGPTCARKIRRAATVVSLVTFKPFQVDKAREAIEQGAVVPTVRPEAYRSVSSDGTTVYLTTIASCTCPAGQKGRTCYHRAAAEILTAA